MEDLNELKRHWEEALTQVGSMKLPPVTTPLEDRGERREVEEQGHVSFDEICEAREREKKLRRALLRQGVEGKRYVRARIYSDLQYERRLQEFMLDQCSNAVRTLAEKEGKSEEEVRSDVWPLLESMYKKLECLKEELREIEDA